MPDEFKILLYFIGVVAIGISFGVLTVIPAYAFITIGGGLILYPLWERLFLK
jgi:hypothetical protein